MKTYLYSCTNSKQFPEEKFLLSKYFDTAEVSFLSSLELLSFNVELNEVRMTLIDDYEQSREKLDWNKTLPAWELYSGKTAKFFPRISDHNWKKEGFELLIFSTLFGWVRHTDRLPYYTLSLKESFSTNSLVINYWKLNSNELLKCVPENSIDLLPDSFKEIFNMKGCSLGIIPKIKFTDRGDQKRIWLNDQLNLLQ